MSTAPLVETTEDRLRRELAESAARQRAEEASEARENKLREEVARLRAGRLWRHGREVHEAVVPGKARK